MPAFLLPVQALPIKKKKKLQKMTLMLPEVLYRLL